MDESKKDRLRRVIAAAVTPKGCGNPTALERVREIQRNPAVAPEWGFWPSHAQVSQWQAVALSLDLSPDSIQHSDGFIKSASFPTEEMQAEFGKRLELVRRLTNKNKSTLEYFSSLLKSLPMPKEMEAMAAGAASENAQAEEFQPAINTFDSNSQPSTVEPASSRTPDSDEQLTWIKKAQEIAQRIGAERWKGGQRQITARNIAGAVAQELEKDKATHGLQGPRSESNVRIIGLKGWRFISPD